MLLKSDIWSGIQSAGLKSFYFRLDRTNSKRRQLEIINDIITIKCSMRSHSVVVWRSGTDFELGVFGSILRWLPITFVSTSHATKVSMACDKPVDTTPFRHNYTIKEICSHTARASPVVSNAHSSRPATATVARVAVV